MLKSLDPSRTLATFPLSLSALIYHATYAMADTVTFIKKSRAKPTNTRKRSIEDEPATTTASGSKSAVVKASRKQDVNPLVQASSGYRSKRAKLDEGSDEDELEREAAKDIGVKYSSSRTINPASRRDELGNDLADEGGIKEGDEALLYSGATDDGMYHGAKSYGSQLPTGSGKFNALQPPSNVRAISIIDFQPDVCKDYKGQSISS